MVGYKTIELKCYQSSSEPLGQFQTKQKIIFITHEEPRSYGSKNKWKENNKNASKTKHGKDLLG